VFFPFSFFYLVLLLLGVSFIAFGLVFSSLTRNQVVAVFLSFGTFLFLWLIEYAESWAGSLSGLVTFLSVTKHIENFAKGVLDSRDVLYYLSFIVFGLFLTRQSVDSLRWRG